MKLYFINDLIVGEVDDSISHFMIGNGSTRDIEMFEDLESAENKLVKIRKEWVRRMTSEIFDDEQYNIIMKQFERMFEELDKDHPSKFEPKKGLYEISIEE